MASLKNQKNLSRLSRRNPQLKINKKLDFDSCSEEDLPRSSSPEPNDLRKKLDFDLIDDGFDLSDALSSPLKPENVGLTNEGLHLLDPRNSSKNTSTLLELKDLNSSGLESNLFDKFSPCRTRSGKIYTSVEKQRNSRNSSRSSVAESRKTETSSKLPIPVFLDNPRSSSRHNSGASAGITTPHSTRVQTSHLQVHAVELNLLQHDFFRDSMDTEEDGPILPPATNKPPPLVHSKRPMSRLQINLNEALSPLVHQGSANLHSPPTNEVRAMKLFDKSPVLGSSPVACQSAFRFRKSRVLFGNVDDENASRRVSAPGGFRMPPEEYRDITCNERKRKRVANVNPFTPPSILASITKKFKSEPNIQGMNNSFINQSVDISVDDEDLDFNPAKRLRVSDIDIRRYEEEFIEIKEIAGGSFGVVKVARHRLDGMIYAIKVTRNQIHGNTHEERVAMNEVFAHAALMKHKHVVRYYNSWVEKGHVYIQNEFCEGGSLANLINEYRKLGRRFPESELKRILLHIAKGLQYIHSKQLVHLDVKPENIFIALDHLTPSPFRRGEEQDGGAKSVPLAPQNPTNDVGPNVRTAIGRGEYSGNESTDSGRASGCDGSRFHVDSHNSVSGVDDRISYKIGDLGHVSQIYGQNIPEEGDCRYMAPELLLDDVNRDILTRADIFSLGLTLYEVASLQELPKNSIDDPMYERLKSGNLPFIEGYSKEFNQLLRSMVHQDANLRPSASKLVSHSFLRSSSLSKSRSQLYKELKETKARLRQLEVELSGIPSWSSKFPPKSPSSSSLHSSPITRSPIVITKSLKSKQRLVGRGTQKSLSGLL